MLGQSPQFLLDATARWRDERPAVIHLTGDADAELLSDLDPRLVARSEPTDLRAVYAPLVSERLLNWVIVAAPNEGWAQTVFGEKDLERLRDSMPRIRWPPGGSMTRTSRGERRR
jgi:leucyl aminopeptidase (aminopeptidase T)